MVRSIDRRHFLKGAAAAAGGVVAATSPLPVGALRHTWADEGDHLRVYVVVIDGLRPDEVALMPQLSELITGGTFYPQARAQMIAETTPNHVSMLTGMRVDRHGVPGNAAPFFAERGLGDGPSDNRRYVQADSLFTLAKRQAPDLRTVAVTSKVYLVEMQQHDRDGDGAADADWFNNPPKQLFVPIAEVLPDIETMTMALDLAGRHDPDFLFLNLGQVDRVGHGDESGGLTEGQAPIGRTATLIDTDNQLRRLVQFLNDQGWWDSTVLLVTADHSMDWSYPHRMIDLADAIADDELLAGEVVAAVNGGAALYALLSPDEPRVSRRLRRLRELALATDGVDEALYIRPNPADGDDRHAVERVHPDWGLTGDRTGDLIVTCRDGWRIGHDGPISNPIPGNHGHVPTLPIPMLVAGGHTAVKAGQRLEPAQPVTALDRDASQAENIDIGSTVAWLLGLRPPPGGFDGRVLSEAFEQSRPDPGPRAVAQDVPSLPTVRRIAGDDRWDTAVKLSRLAFPGGLPGGDEAPPVVVASGEEIAGALVATPLALQLGSPVLLGTRERGLPAGTIEEVERLGASRAVIVGDQTAMSRTVEDDLVRAGLQRNNIERLAGADRFSTAAHVARRLGVNETHRQALLIGVPRHGHGWPSSALAAGVFAGSWQRPMLLTMRDELPAVTRSVITELGVERIIIGGDTGAVSDAVMSTLRRDGFLVERIAGADEYETGRRLAERHIREGGLTDNIFLVSGDDPAGALAAGASIGKLGGTMMLAPPHRLRDGATRHFLRQRGDQFVRLMLIGDRRALSARLEEDVVDLITARRTRHGQ